MVAWIGRLDPQKDPLAAVEAFDTIANSAPECRLVMAGDGPLRGLVESRIEGVGLGERVVMLGRISEVPSLLARSVALLLTSRWEGMPNVVLEAMEVEAALDGGFDCGVIVTSHREFDYGLIAERAPLLVDTRNALKGQTGSHIHRL